MSLKIGLIGAGMVGQLHAQAMSHVPGIKIAAVADLRPELRGLVAAKYGIEKQYRSHLDLLADQSLDAVAVVVRRVGTSAVVRDCLLAGKHVFSEKPMAMTASAARELAALGKERGLFYSIGYQKRHDPGTERCLETLRRLMASGELGRLGLVRVWNHTGKDREEDAGLLMTQEARPDGLSLDATYPEWLPASFAASYDRFVNAYCHDVNMVHHFLSERPQVEAAVLDSQGGQSVILRLGDRIASMALTLSELGEWTQRGEWDEGLEFHFEGGRLLIAFPPPLYRNRCAKVVLRRGSQPEEIISDGTSAQSVFTIQAANFLADLKAGRPSRSSAESSVRDMELIEDIWAKGLNLAKTKHPRIEMVEG